MNVNYIALAVPAFFLLIGLELAVSLTLGRRLYRFADAITDLSCGIGQQVTGVLMKGALVAGYGWVYEHWTLVRFDEVSPAPWLVAFVGVDFFYYWWHRASHEVACLWAVHVVHHQSEDYNLAVALRQAWFSSASSWAFYAPLALLGVPPLVFVAVSAWSTLYQFWIHTRVIGKLGILEWLFNTPSHHRVHHGRDPKYLDRNYGATLIVWDRLFGSFQVEEEEPRYGTIAAYRSWNPVWANFEFWVTLVAKARRTPRFVDKLRVWFMPPGWQPAGSADDRDDDSETPRVRFNTETTLRLRIYVLAQFVLVTIATTLLMVRHPTLGPGVNSVGAALVLATTVVWGALFEGRRWAVPLEFTRLATVAAAAAVAWQQEAISEAAVLGVVAASLVAAAWVGWLGWRMLPPLAEQR
jgi:sterol desaturase/sphingolipid hydroxylase (fatty acid hydroxylase superfamily)